MTGILAVFNDCAPGEEAAYEAWYHGEHLPERVALPGFRWGRRYRAIDAAPAFATYYETESPETLADPAYRARLDAPTPETRRIMSGVFRNMIRAVCTRTHRGGAIRGACTVIARFADAPVPPLAADTPLWRERWERAAPPEVGTAEERLRGGDASIAGALLADCADPGTALRLAAGWRARYPQASVGAYALISSLAQADLAPQSPSDS